MKHLCKYLKPLGLYVSGMFFAFTLYKGWFVLSALTLIVDMFTIYDMGNE